MWFSTWKEFVNLDKLVIVDLLEDDEFSITIVIENIWEEIVGMWLLVNWWSKLMKEHINGGSVTVIMASKLVLLMLNNKISMKIWIL